MRPRNQFKLPEMVKSNKKRANENPFAALEELDGAETKHDAEVQGEQNSYEESFPTLTTYNPNVSWGDMSDDE